MTISSFHPLVFLKTQTGHSHKIKSGVSSKHQLKNLSYPAIHLQYRPLPQTQKKYRDLLIQVFFILLLYITLSLRKLSPYRIGKIQHRIKMDNHNAKFESDKRQFGGMLMICGFCASKSSCYDESSHRCSRIKS